MQQHTLNTLCRIIKFVDSDSYGCHDRDCFVTRYLYWYTFPIRRLFENASSFKVFFHVYISLQSKKSNKINIISFSIIYIYNLNVYRTDRYRVAYRRAGFSLRLKENLPQVCEKIAEDFIDALAHSRKRTFIFLSLRIPRFLLDGSQALTYQKWSI